ncbi:MAG: hypothetical protein P8Y64_02135 [Gammaproteobacteria bacterium]
MITAKGKEEIHKLIASDLVESWSETDQKLRNVVKMLLLTRPDLIRLYFFPAVWQRITELDKRQAAAVILAALKAEVVAQAGAPGVAAREQARFYLETRIPTEQHRRKHLTALHNKKSSPKGALRFATASPVAF